MYGTVARMRLKPGAESKMMDTVKDFKALKVPGYVGSTLYRLDAGSNAYIMTVVFADKGSYVKNADDPAQDKRYQEMLALREGEPEWMDGEIIYRQA